MRSAARIAGDFVRSNSKLTDSSLKTNANDLVTVADIKSQDILRKELLKAFPDAIVVSEEDPEEKRQTLMKADFTGFVLDPIDGTFNFKRNMQESAISVGYIENGNPKFGVIYDPYKDELFEAELGKGAKCNGQAIHVSDQKSLEGASIATSNGYDYAAAARNLQREIAIYEKTDVMPWISCPGSAVLVLAWVAAGRVDAIHHTGFKPWDNAAGLLIVREAGGIAHKLGSSDDAKFTDAAILAANLTIGQELQKIFAGIDPELLK